VQSFTRSCPAKVNLFLKVIGRRPDGYHSLITVMQPLTLADILTLTLTENGIVLECDTPGLPRDARNLAFQAAQVFQKEISQEFGVRIQLKKNIPTAAGVGGGSSDAAGVLVGLNSLTGFPLSSAVLHRLASKLGADVPFFLLSGPALGEGIGTQLSPLRLPAYWYVLVNPGYQVSTRWVYDNLKLPSGEASMEDIWTRLSGQSLETWLYNDLESVTLSTYPRLAVLKQALERQGALASLMSGSGPTVFGVFLTHQGAREAARELEKAYGGWITVTQGVPGDHLLTAPQETSPWMN
jgi:4-diphosphocytidyl-2-C-methyl-D-erythritol kinase